MLQEAVVSQFETETLPKAELSGGQRPLRSPAPVLGSNPIVP